MTNKFKPFQPPFKFDKDTGMILDSNSTQVLEVKGWAHLTDLTDEFDAIDIQDKIGQIVTSLMNKAND